MIEYKFENSVAAIRSITLPENNKAEIWQRLLKMERRQEPDLSRWLVRNLAFFSLCALILLAIFVGNSLNSIPAADSLDAVKQVPTKSITPVSKTSIVPPATPQTPELPAVTATTTTTTTSTVTTTDVTTSATSTIN